MNEASLTCLGIICMVCLTGIFSHKYHDNWLQFVGLCGLVVWSVARWWQIFNYEEGHEIGPQQLLSHASIALFALGTFVKVWRQTRTPKPPAKPPAEMDTGNLRHVVGGKR